MVLLYKEMAVHCQETITHQAAQDDITKNLSDLLSNLVAFKIIHMQRRWRYKHAIEVATTLFTT